MNNQELMPITQMASCGTTSNNNEITEEETGQLNTHERERPLIPPPPLPRTTLMASSGTTSNNNEITEEGDQAHYQQGQTFSTPIQYSTQPQRQSTTPYFDEYNTTQSYFPYPPQGDQNQFQQGRFEGDQAQYQQQFQQGQAFSIPIQYSTQSQRTDPYFDGHINTQPYFGYPPQGTDGTVENRLWKAIDEGNWVKARCIVNTEQVTWTSKIDAEGNSALHYVVDRRKYNEVAR